MIQIFLISMMFVVGGCAANHTNTATATLNTNPINLTDSQKMVVEEKADKIMKKQGFDLKCLQKEITENDTAYHVQYKVICKNYKGGGGLLVFRKSDLKLVDKTFEQ